MLNTELRLFSRQLSRLTRTNSRPWICGPCRHAKPWVSSKRGITGDASPKDVKSKPYYVTTPIFYVNASPHVGHLYTILLADILKRWQVLLGNSDAKLLTGTDEHGMKIQQAALDNGLEPQELCDRNCRTFKTLAKEANVSHDHFIRTTDMTHKEAVQYFWECLNHRGYIYQGKHEGWYSISDETFYPSSAVHATLDPATGRKIMSSIETGKEVEWSQETNYHFKLSALQDRLLEYYKENKGFIYPKKYMDDIVNNVSSGLQDLSISRPVERLTWGVRVPGDDTQTIYVWLDALVNYLTYAGYPFTPGQEHKSIWPADVHVVGKDIIRFHGIYWPAFLLALNLPLPRRILTHSHWTINREKMSKSTGNVVNPIFAMSRFGVDPMRFFLIFNGRLVNDADYENSYIINHYNKGLKGNLGNLTSRLLRSKQWNVRDSISKATGGQLPKPNDRDQEHEDFLRTTPQIVEDLMENPNPPKALEFVLSIVYTTNKYVQEARPWTLVAESTPEDKNVREEVSRIIYNVAESLRIAGILLQPFMPGKADELLNMLGVAEEAEKRSFHATKFGFDCDYGESKVTLKKGVEGTLFPPLLSDD